MSRFWWRLQVWFMYLPEKMGRFDNKRTQKYSKEENDRRNKISTRIYLICGSIVLACYIFWIMTGSSNPKQF